MRFFFFFSRSLAPFVETSLRYRLKEWKFPDWKRGDRKFSILSPIPSPNLVTEWARKTCSWREKRKKTYLTGLLRGAHSSSLKADSSTTEEEKKAFDLRWLLNPKTPTKRLHSMAVLGSEPLLDQRLRDKSTGKETRVRKGSCYPVPKINKIAISVKNKYRFARSLRSLSISIGRATEHPSRYQGK